jgi:calpain-15
MPSYEKWCADLTFSTDHYQTHQYFAFSVSNSGSCDYRVTFNFTQLEGFSGVDSQVTWNLTIKPGQKADICELRYEQACSYRYTYTYEQLLMPRTAEVASMQRNCFKQVPLDIADAHDIVQVLPDSKFIDPYFPPTAYSLYGALGQHHDFKVEWRRPEKFLPGAISVFEGRIEAQDIIQGCLNDCWFLTAACALTANQASVEQLFITKTTQKSGIYKLKICKDGEWQVVTVDDLFPCYQSGSPLYSKSHGSELWVLLLEKAYAKLHGSYSALNFGKATEALTDLTGNPANVTMVKQASSDTLETCAGFIGQELLRLHRADTAIIARTHSEADHRSAGLIPQHFYNVTLVAQYQGQILVKLRNPWGRFEWKGLWSDTSSVWTAHAQAALQHNVDENDGSFWMNCMDFSRYFSEIVHTDLTKTNEHRVKNLFMMADSPGDARYFYKVTAHRAAAVVVSLCQEDKRTEGVEQLRPTAAVAIDVANADRHPIIRGGFVNMRDYKLSLTLQPGQFYITPKLNLGSTQLRTVPDRVSLVTSGGDMHPWFKSTIKDLFRRFDNDISQELDFAEFLQIASRLGNGLGMTPASFEHEIKGKYTSTPRGITLQGLYEMMIDAVMNQGEDVVRRWLETLGYDASLISRESRAFIMTFHSTESITVEAILNSA